MSSNFLVYKMDSAKERAVVISTCHKYMQTGAIPYPKYFHKLGGKLKSLRMAQLCNSGNWKGLLGYAGILEKTLAKHYKLESGVLYLNRRGKRVLSLGGINHEDKFVVLVGSKCSCKREKSLREVHKRRIAQCLEAGHTYSNQVFSWEKEGVSMWLKRPIAFGSATAAANFVTGSPTSGMIHWKNWEGRQLRFMTWKNQFGQPN